MQKKWLQSSANPENISLMIKGFGVAIIPAIVMIGGILGLNLVEANLIQFVNSIATAASAIMIAYGLGRKIYLKLFK